MSAQFLVTTSRSILHVDVATRAVSAVDRGAGLYYGVAEYAGQFYIAARRRMVSSDVPAGDERGEIVVLNRTLSKIDTLSAPFPLRDMHEIAWHKAKLWVTCAFDNMIAIFDGHNWQRWYPLGKPASEPYDRNHINSLHFEYDTVVLLTHNWGSSVLHFFALDTLVQEREIALGRQAHNIWHEGGEYRTCSSGEGRLLGDKNFCVQTGGFPRGVAKSDGMICVGVSEWAERGQRDFTTGFLRFFSADWRNLFDLALPGEGLILDIQPYSPEGQFPSEG
jgi:hypothetical protein